MEHKKEALEEEVQTDEYVQYAIAFEKNLSLLERALHSEEEPELIAQKTLIAAAEFYDGDWCGIIEGDLEMEAWCPILWYDCITGGMTETRFRELEEFTSFERWVKALYACEPVIIPDTSIYKESNPGEYELYSRCEADSILAVPFWKNPTGFLIVRNPKRYINRSSFLQMLAYVVFSSVTEKKLLERGSKAFSPDNIKDDKDVIINLFGKMEIYTSKGVLREEELNAPIMWRFVAYLIMHKNQTNLPATIYEAIWEDGDIDKASSKVKAAAFRLQSVFSIICDQRLVISTAKGYQINPELNIVTDVEQFDEFWRQSQNAVTLQTKIKLLQDAVALYKGDIYEAASGEHWLMPHEISYRYKCLGICNELMKLFFDSQNYTSVQHYAHKALELDEANPDAYYWLIRTLKKKDSMGMVKGEMLMAEHVLGPDLYDELIKKLDRAKDSE
ncbi:MAG: hypothetical protein J6B94_00390 [Lachnospiraceae bacterium]|nr:hypothetical protein [Lachnospiraceae bacterium]